MIYVLTMVLGVILALNVKATLLVVSDQLSERNQRLIQICLVWLLPIVGAFIVLAVHRGEEKHSGQYSRESENKGDSSNIIERD